MNKSISHSFFKVIFLIIILITVQLELIIACNNTLEGYIKDDLEEKNHFFINNYSNLSEENEQNVLEGKTKDARKFSPQESSSWNAGPLVPASKEQRLGKNNNYSRTPDDITVCGYVKFINGSAIDNAEVSLQTKETTTNSFGYYEFLNISYNSFYLKMEKQSPLLSPEGYRYMTCMPIRADINRTNQIIPGKTLWINFTTTPVLNLPLRLYNPAGELLRQNSFDDYNDHWTQGTRPDMISVDHALVYLEDFEAINGSKQNLPVLIVPTKTETGMITFFEIPGFGKIRLYVQNGSVPFYAEKTGSIYPVLINFEAARTRFTQVIERQMEYQLKGYEISEKYYSAISQANSSLQFAEILRYADEQACAAASLVSLNHTLHASEELIISVARQRVARNRRISGEVKIINTNGEPIKGAEVTTTLECQDFNFGVLCCYPDNPELILELGITNAYANPFWAWGEPNPGNYTWEYLENFMGWNCFKDELPYIFGEPAYFAKNPWEGNGTPGFIPRWAYELSFDDFKVALINYTERLYSRYGHKIDWYRVINEAHTTYANKFGFSRGQMTELTRALTQTVHNLDPSAGAIANVAGVLGMWGYQFRYPYGQFGEFEMHPYYYLEDLIYNQGVPLDAIGLQMYAGSLRNELNDNLAFAAIDIFMFDEIIRTYSALGKTIYISEVEQNSYIPANMRGKANGYWHDYWTEELQADWLEYLFTIAYSYPNVLGINWWNPFSTGELSYGGGLIDVQMDPSQMIPIKYVPREAYYRYQSLLNQEWYSSLIETTNVSGIISVNNVFAGNYSLFVKKDGFRTNQRYGLIVHDGDTIVIVLYPEENKFMALIIVLITLGSLIIITSIVGIVIIRKKRGRNTTAID